MPPDLTPPATTTQTTYVLDFSIPVGLKGETGATGAIGPEPVLSVGTVTTGSAGSNASVTIR